jgi:hypothetical protein
MATDLGRARFVIPADEQFHPRAVLDRDGFLAALYSPALVFLRRATRQSYLLLVCAMSVSGAIFLILSSTGH